MTVSSISELKDIFHLSSTIAIHNIFRFCVKYQCFCFFALNYYLGWNVFIWYKKIIISYIELNLTKEYLYFIKSCFCWLCGVASKSKYSVISHIYIEMFTGSANKVNIFMYRFLKTSPLTWISSNQMHSCDKA